MHTHTQHIPNAQAFKGESIPEEDIARVAPFTENPVRPVSSLYIYLVATHTFVCAFKYIHSAHAPH